MAVVLADGEYLLRARPHPWPRDAQGAPVPTAEQVVAGPVPGAAVRQSDGSVLLRLDPRVWPVRPGDVVERIGDGARWTVSGLPLLRTVPGAPDVDHVRLTGIAEVPEVDVGYPV